MIIKKKADEEALARFDDLLVEIENMSEADALDRLSVTQKSSSE
jgi:hypothetical protein